MGQVPQGLTRPHIRQTRVPLQQSADSIDSRETSPRGRFLEKRSSGVPLGRAVPGTCRERSLVCWHTMKRTTVKLSDELDARLRHEAQRRGTTVSELTREAIAAHLGGGGKGRRRLLAAGAGRSGRSDVSEQIERILRAEV